MRFEMRNVERVDVVTVIVNVSSSSSSSRVHCLQCSWFCNHTAYREGGGQIKKRKVTKALTHSICKVYTLSLRRRTLKCIVTISIRENVKMSIEASIRFICMWEMAFVYVWPWSILQHFRVLIIAKLPTLLRNVFWANMSKGEHEKRKDVCWRQIIPVLD